MNTVKIGDEFEAKSYKLILKAVKNGEFGIDGTLIRPFSKRAYYSIDRERDIIFDLALELWPENAKKCTLAYIIECKSYSTKKVPVDDVEEFYSKYSQLQGLAVKGVMITDNSFQSGARTFAKNKGIMLIEVDSDKNHSIILHRSEKESSIDINVDDIITRLITTAIGSPKIEGLERLSSKDIEKRIYDVLTKAKMQSAGEDLFKFIDHLMSEYDLQFDFESKLETVNGSQLLGYCDIRNNKIYIDKSLFNLERFPFIFGHELGHYFLHKNLKANQEVYNSFQDSEYSIILDRHELKNTKHWIEWQANKFSALLFLPKEQFVKHLMGFRKSIGISKYQHIYLDKQPINQKDFYETLKYLSEHFGVSKTAVRYRIEELELITYAEGQSDFRDIVSRVLFE